MPDKMTPEQRHKNMAAIRAKNTKPEMIVRRFLWRHGFRYRLNYDRLPGKPDIVLRMYRLCIFINGCFWHGHEGCPKYTVPKSNTEFWVKKVTRNRQRDEEVRRKLQGLGWRCMTIWECELEPGRREELLQRLLYTLSICYLQDHGAKPYSFDEEKMGQRVADED